MRVRRLITVAKLTFVSCTLIFATVLSAHFNIAHADAADTVLVSGTVTNQSGQGINNVSVSATDPGGTTILFGPTSTISDGTYTLGVDPGTYDFHFVPQNGTGLSSVVDS